MIVVIGLQACDACRMARKALTVTGAAVSFRDLRSDPPTAEEVAAWQAALGNVLLNKRSTTWRNLPEVERTGDAIALMVAHPTLIKRPVIIPPDAAPLLGWTAETRAALGLRAGARLDGAS